MNWYLDISLKNKLLLAFAIAVITLTIYYQIKRFTIETWKQYNKLINNDSEHNIANNSENNHTEGFISQPGMLDEIDSRKHMWPVDDQTGLKPLVLKNRDTFPIISLAYIYGAGGPQSSHLGPILDILRNRVYPFSPLIPLQSDANVLEYVGSNKDMNGNANNDNNANNANKLANVRFGLVRENVLLEYVSNDNAGNNTASNNLGWDVWCPMYHEVMLALGHKRGMISNMQQLRDVRADGNNFKVAVLECDLPYFQLVCRNLNVPWKDETRQFQLQLINSDTDLKNSFLDMGKGELDLIFMLTHPKNSIIQEHVIRHPTKLIEVYPPSAIPDIASQNSPYDPDEPASDLRLKFARDMKRDIPWIFREQMDRSRIPVVLHESGNSQGDMSQRSGSLIYYTFRVRTLLIGSSNNINNSNGKDIHNKLLRREYIKAKKDIADNLLKYYQTMESSIMKWNSDSSEIQGGYGKIHESSRYIDKNNTGINNTKLGKLVSFNSSDRNSFEFDAMGSIPSVLPISREWKEVLLREKLLKIEIVYSCKL